MQKLALWIAVVFFAGMGLIAFYDPPLVQWFFDPPEYGADMRYEIRAVYGGFGVFVAAMLIWSQNRGALGDGIRLAMALSLSGMAFGRVVSLAIEPADTIFPALTIPVELGVAALLIYVNRAEQAGRSGDGG